MVRIAKMLSQQKKWDVPPPPKTLDQPNFISVGTRSAAMGRAPRPKPAREGIQSFRPVFRKDQRAKATKGGRSTQEKWNCMFQKSPKPIKAKDLVFDNHFRVRVGTASMNPTKNRQLPKSK